MLQVKNQISHLHLVIDSAVSKTQPNVNSIQQRHSIFQAGNQIQLQSFRTPGLFASVAGSGGAVTAVCDTVFPTALLKW